MIPSGHGPPLPRLWSWRARGRCPSPNFIRRDVLDRMGSIREALVRDEQDSAPRLGWLWPICFPADFDERLPGRPTLTGCNLPPRSVGLRYSSVGCAAHRDVGS